jgi:leucyl/phenylalanyl-tRNA---protein transferase
LIYWPGASLPILAFPPLHQADESGLLAFGGDLSVDSLKLAYAQGIFPWPINEQYPLAWFSPDPRGILFFDHLKISRSLKKSIRQKNWTIRFNQNFKRVIQECAKQHHQRDKATWITADIIDAYEQFHLAGYAFCVEVLLEDKLVGGLYGVRMGRAFSGESMFYKVNNASKIAIVALSKWLHTLHSICWLDTQMVTPVVASLGGVEIKRDHFLNHLKQQTLLDGSDIFSRPHELTQEELIQLLS